MPAVAVVADVIISDVIGSSIVDAVAAVTASTIAGDIVSGAVIGALGGGASAAIQGGNIWKGVEQGAIGGGVGAGVSDVLLGSDVITQGEGPNAQIVSQGSEGLLPNAGTGLTALSKGLSTGLGQYAATGNAKSALESGAITGVVDYAIPSQASSDAGKALESTERGLLSTGLRSLLSPSDKSAAQFAGGVLTGSAPSSQPSPGSAALGQVLNSGAPVIGSATGEEKNKPGGWNVESLRYMGSGDFNG